MRINWAWAADRLHRLIRNHPFKIVALGLCLAALSFTYTRGHLEFWTERNVLISQKSPSAMLYREYRKEFKDDYVVLVLRSKDLEQAKRFASRLGRRMEGDEDTIQQVFYRIPMETFRRQALLFLEPKEIEDLHAKIAKHQDLLERLASSPGLITLLRTINEQISRALVRTAVSGLFSEEKEDEEEEDGKVDPEDLRLMSSLMDSLYTWLTDAPRYRSPWGVFMQDPGGMSEDGYLIDEERGWLFMMAYLKDLEGSFNMEGAAIERIREHIREVSAQIPDVEIAITGTPALNSDEMASSLKDMTRAMGLALVLVSGLFVLGFGEARRPLAAVLALLLGIVWALGWLSLTVGHLTILSMAFGSILVGLGIDFGIHLVARYEKERNHGQDPPTALRTTLHRVGRAIFSGAITTAAAFFALNFSAFRGIKEFGWIAGWGILCCLVAELLLLPVLLLWLDRKGGEHPKKGDGPERARSPRLERIVGWPARHPAWVVPLAGLLAVVAVLPWGKVRFDYNLLHLQPKGTEAVEWELKLLEAQGNASIYAAVLVDSLEEARERTRQNEALSLVNKVESLADYLPTDPKERMNRILELAPLFEGVELDTQQPSAPSPKRVKRWIGKIRFKLREEEKEEAEGRVQTEAGVFPPPDTVSGASLRTERVLRLLESEETQEKQASLAEYQDRLFNDFRRKIELIMASLDPVPITVEGLPELLKKRFIGTSGRLVLQIYPKEDIWELDPQRRFVEQLASVNPEVTGIAVQNYDATKSLLDAYIQGGLYAVCAIVLILFVDFRHPILVLLALLPLMFGGLWTLLGMKILRMAFNPANLVIIPLLVGIGVDNGIHVIRHFLGSGSSDEEIAGSSTGRAITISTLTTMAGFGSLIIARHQGIHSVGALLTLAMASCLLASLVVLPSVLGILPEGMRHRIWRMGQPKKPIADP